MKLPDRIGLLLCSVITFLLVPDGIALADGYTVKNLVFLPPEFYVGDTVELRLRIDVGDRVLPSEVGSIPESRWIEIEEIRVIPIAGEYEIRVEFSSFRTGQLEIPAFEVGELAIDPIPIDTASIRKDSNDQLVGVFDPVLLPGTTLLIAISGAVVFFGPLLLLLSIAWVRRIVGRVHRGAGRPYRRLTRALDALAKNAESVSARDFSVQLSESFRNYLAERGTYDYRAATSSEVAERLVDEFAQSERAAALRRMVSSIDRAKFGGGAIGSAERVEELAVVRSIAEAIEEHRKGGGSRKPVTAEGEP